MRYLIIFEKDKSLGEITFEYQNTMVFREEERKLVQKIKLTYFVINVFWVSGWLSNSTYDSVYSHNFPCNSIPPSKETREWYKSWMSMSLIDICSIIFLVNILGTFTFLHLFYLMYRRHKLEFQRSKNLMLIIFLIMTSMIIGFFYLIIMDVKSGLNIDFSIWITKAEEFPFQKLEVYSCWIL